nr:hypothetical protein CFP56_28598 [Quercus suber]
MRQPRGTSRMPHIAAAGGTIWVWPPVSDHVHRASWTATCGKHDQHPSRPAWGLGDCGPPGARYRRAYRDPPRLALAGTTWHDTRNPRAAVRPIACAIEAHSRSEGSIRRCCASQEGLGSAGKGRRCGARHKDGRLSQRSYMGAEVRRGLVMNHAGQTTRTLAGLFLTSSLQRVQSAFPSQYTATWRVSPSSTPSCSFASGPV